MFYRYLLIFNLILIIIMSIFEIKRFKKLIFWALIIFIFSIFGYITYLIFGNALKFSAKKQLNNKHKSTKNYLKQAKIELNIEKPIKNKIAKYIYKSTECIYWPNNSINVYTHGQVFLENLLQNIKHAKNHIHLEFYIFSDDETGRTLASALIEKAKQGIDIKIIYDAFGSRKTKKNFWQKLRDNNIQVESFFPPFFKLDFLNFKINYRNHRKIVVIDGKIGYMGGINIRNDHMNKHKKLSPWRDTQIKIIGTSVYTLQDIFLNDWYFCHKSTPNTTELKNYFPKIQNIGDYSLQIVDDGPDFEQQRILDIYIKLICNAKKYIYIQTPYFIINNQLLNSLIDAFNRGVEIKIFIPQKPDKNIVYTASLININKLFNLGIQIYLYKGFIHSKVFITENIVSIGSCNFDYRSFFLNFETTCFCYNKDFIQKNVEIIKNDIKNSVILTKKQYKKLKHKNLLSELFYKIISNFL